MTPQEFVAKWSKIQQKETAVDKGHFYDLCELVGHLKPEAFDPSGHNFSFQTYALKPGGQKGFADVYFRDHFIWEYKGPHKELDKAYAQLQLYRESLQNPPLLITSDIHTIIIHTNFNNYPTVQHTITFDDILRGEGVEKLRWAFFQPERFRPDKTQAEITKASADTFVAVAEAMKKHLRFTGEAYTPEQLAHFLARLLFCLFAEDLELLPHKVFTQIVRSQGVEHADLQFGLRNLFREMRGGGVFGFYRIREFDGTLFDDEFVPTIPDDLARALLQAAEQDWAQVDPAIFGTLFERVIDPEKRAQLGAHYTSVDDIMLIVEPVLMEPLRRRWDEVRRQASRLETSDAAQTSDVSKTSDVYTLLADFAAEIAAVRVLDPACGSGNFLYVALRQLLDLQKQVIAYAARRDLPQIPLTVGPEQLLGIEVNPYAHELAQITAWIGYLQWRHENGFAAMPDPVLRPLRHIRRMDAILAYDADGKPTEPEWPPADVIIGNPPFLGAKWMQRELGLERTVHIREVYGSRISGTADLVMYWFEKARAYVGEGKVNRVGLLATNTVRQGGSAETLKRIKETGDIFLAYTDKPWVLEGASLRVSLIGFDNGTEAIRRLNGLRVDRINSDLTSNIDLDSCQTLFENVDISFRGHERGGPFLIDETQAKRFLQHAQNAAVIHPWFSGRDLTDRPRNEWVIDFGEVGWEEAQQFADVLNYLEKQWKEEQEKAEKSGSRAAKQRDKWWRHRRPASDLRNAIASLNRYIVTPLVSRHRLFIWLSSNVRPDTRLVSFARDDDYFFGVLHSRMHELWSLKRGASHGIGNDPTYNNTTCFETFPFPWPPGREPAESADPRVAEIAHWARALHTWREAWLNPPPPPGNAIDVAHAKMVQNRTLTNLYNGLVYYRETRPDRSQRPVRSAGPFMQAAFDKVTRRSVSRAEIQELDDMHTALDNAVLDAYGWPHHLSEEEILERLLALNLQRAGEI